MKKRQKFSVVDLINELRDDRADDIWDTALSVSNHGKGLWASSEQQPARKPKPRLNREDYVGRRKYHITLTTQKRNPFFEFRTDAKPVETVLLSTADKLQFRLLAYCFMPDHLHVLLQGRQKASDLLRFVQRFKQVSSYEFKRESGDHLWQQSFYDRVLRQTDDPLAVATYIFENPASAGLAAGSPAYELRGGEYYFRAWATDEANSRGALGRS